MCRTSAWCIYTYVYTMANCSARTARGLARRSLCDKRDPVGGEAIEGAALQQQWTSIRRISRFRCVTG